MSSESLGSSQGNTSRRRSGSNSNAGPSGIPSLRSLRSLLPFGPSKNSTPARTTSKAATKSPTKEGSFYHGKSMSMSIGASPQPAHTSTPVRGALSSFTRKASATASLGRDRKGSLSKETPTRTSFAWDPNMAKSLPSRDRNTASSALPVISIHRNFSEVAGGVNELEKELNTRRSGPQRDVGSRTSSSISRLDKPLPLEPGGRSPAPSTQQLELDSGADTLAPLMNEQPPVLRTPSPTAPMDLSTIMEAETSGAIDPDSSGVSISKHLPAESAPTSPDSPYLKESLLHSPPPHLSSASHSPISRQASSLLPSSRASEANSVPPSSDGHHADMSDTHGGENSPLELSTSDVHSQVMDALRRTSCSFTGAGHPPVVVDEPPDEPHAQNSTTHNHTEITIASPRPQYESRSRPNSIISPPRTPLQRDTETLDLGLSPRTVTTSDFSPATSTVEYYARRGPPPPLPLSEKPTPFGERPLVSASLPPSARPSPSPSPGLPSPRAMPPSRNPSPSRMSYFTGQASPTLQSARSSPRLQPSPLQPSPLASSQTGALSRRGSSSPQLGSSSPRLGNSSPRLGSSSPRLRPSVHNVFWDEVTSRHKSQSSNESSGQYTPRASLESSRFSSARPSLDRSARPSLDLNRTPYAGRGPSYGLGRTSLDVARRSETSLDRPNGGLHDRATLSRARLGLDFDTSPSPADASDATPSYVRMRKRSLSVDQGNQLQTPIRASSSTRPSTAMGGSVGRRLDSASLGHRLDSGTFRRPDTSLSGATSVSGRSAASSTSRRITDPLRTPGPGPRTLNAFRAAGVFDEDDPLASAKSRSSEDVLEKSRTALERSANVLDRTRSPSISLTRSGSVMGSARGKYPQGMRAPSELGERRVSARKASWTSAGPTSPGAHLADSPTFTFSTPRSASTAPTSVSGGSHDDELRELQAKHADEMAALLGALGDAQRSARLLRSENGELRERADEMADEVERLQAERSRNAELVARLEEQLEFVQKERDDMRAAVEEMATEMERMRNEGEAWMRERDEDTRERERLRKKLAETSVALRMAEVRARLNSSGGSESAGNTTLTAHGLSHATSLTLLNGSVKGFGSEANDSLHSSPLLLMGGGGSPLRDTSPLHLRAGSVDWEGESDVGERTRRFNDGRRGSITNSHSRSGSSSNGRLRTSRRLSGASSVFPTLPNNMSMIFSEDDGAWAGSSQGHSVPSLEPSPNRRGTFEDTEREGSPTIAVPLPWVQRFPIRSPSPTAGKWTAEADAQDVQDARGRGRSRASTGSSASCSPSPRDGSPGSLFLRPEDEQHLRDMESFDLSAGRAELDVVDEEL